MFTSGDTPNPLTGKKMPVMTGHEITGTVDRVGESVPNVVGGDRQESALVEPPSVVM